jgi:hypothetical protein
VSSPSPIGDPESWQFAEFGDIQVPPVGFGTVIVDCPSAIKTDSKEKKGKVAATITKNEKEQSVLTITVKFLAAAWEQNPAVEANLDLIDPNGPNKGGPFEFTFPGLGPGAPKYVQVTKVTRPVKWAGTLGEVTITAKETDLAVAGSGGGSGTTTTNPAGLTPEQRLALEAERAVLNFQNISDLVPLATSDEVIKGQARDRIQKRNARIAAITNQLEAGDYSAEEHTGSVTPTSADAKNVSPPGAAKDAFTTGKNAPNGKP